jgi:hypothetical protein
MGDGICELWGVRPKAPDAVEAFPDGLHATGGLRGRALDLPPGRPTRGRRIGVGTFAVPARRGGYAPVVAGFPPKATLRNRRREGGASFPATHGGCTCENGADLKGRARSKGCGCGGRPKQAR